MHASQQLLYAVEIPFLAIAVFFAFRCASAMRGGVFGRGMGLLAWGFLIMAVAHVYLLLDHLLELDLLETLFGSFRDQAFVAVVVLTWFLQALGFHRIHQAVRG